MEKFYRVETRLGGLTQLPEDFNLDSALSFLDSINAGEIEEVQKSLVNSFSWNDTPQGFHYWDSVYESLPKVKSEAIIQIQIWSIFASIHHLSSHKNQ